MHITHRRYHMDSSATSRNSTRTNHLLSTFGFIQLSDVLVPTFYSQWNPWDNTKQNYIMKSLASSLHNTAPAKRATYNQDCAPTITRKRDLPFSSTSPKTSLAAPYHLEDRATTTTVVQNLQIHTMLDSNNDYRPDSVSKHPLFAIEIRLKSVRRWKATATQEPVTELAVVWECTTSHPHQTAEEEQLREWVPVPVFPPKAWKTISNSPSWVPPTRDAEHAGTVGRWWWSCKIESKLRAFIDCRRGTGSGELKRGKPVTAIVREVEKRARVVWTVLPGNVENISLMFQQYLLPSSQYNIAQCTMQWLFEIKNIKVYCFAK